LVRASGLACIAGALITAVGGAVSQVVRASTSVSPEVWSFPWTSETFVAISLLWSVSHVLVLIGLLGLGRSGVAGPSRMAKVGVGIALTGTLLLLAGELAGLPVRDADFDSSGVALVGALFGFGTLLSAIGLLAAGRATLKARLWGGWRRFVPLLAGVWAVVLIALPATAVISAGVGVFGLCFLALGVALYTQPSPRAQL